MLGSIRPPKQPPFVQKGCVWCRHWKHVLGRSPVIGGLGGPIRRHSWNGPKRIGPLSQGRNG